MPSRPTTRRTVLREIARPWLRVVVIGWAVMAGVREVVAVMGQWLSWQSWLLILLAILLVATFEYAVRLRFPPKPGLRPLRYLSNAESDLGTVVRGVAWHSAWGKWYSAQMLAQQGKLDEFGEPFVVQTAKSLVCKAMMDGDLLVRGRPPDETGYELILNTDWRLAALWVERDPATRWRVVVRPRTDVDPTLISRLLNYQDLIMESRQVEELWPAEEPATDAARRKLLRKAKRANADPAAIARLS
jgi:hypothetical protein